MFSKRAHAKTDETDAPAKKLKAVLADAFLSNSLDGQRMQKIFELEHQSGVRGFEKLAKAGNSGKSSGHIARDLRTTLLKGSKWPGLYYAPVTFWSIRHQCKAVVEMPFLLPHEVIALLAERASSLQLLLAEDNMSMAARKHLAFARQELGRPDLIGLGLWGDGCPCKFDRSQSLEVFSLNLPGAVGDVRNMRFVITAIHKHFCITHDTFDSIMQVIVWSLERLALGEMPGCRHDGSSWAKSDACRKGRAHEKIPAAVLVEARGDWAYFKNAYRLPQHNELNGMCWFCNCTPSQVRDVGANAEWRRNRLSHWQLLERMAHAGLSLSPLFNAPCFRSTVMQIDWLHTIDQGTAADYLGNFMYLLCCSKMPGADHKKRVSSLFLDIMQFYEVCPQDSQLQYLTVGMIRVGSKSPHLNCKAAVARNLIPWAVLAGERYLDSSDAFESTVKQCGLELQGCYRCLSQSTFNAATLEEHCRKFAVLLVALESASVDKALWHVKPKIHLMQELCETQEGCPSTSWVYRDEDFGGSVAALSQHRGGAKNPHSVAKALLQRFMAKHPFPRLA